MRRRGRQENPMRPGHGLPRTRRIRKGPEIRALMGRGIRKRTSHLDVFFADSASSHCRWGLVVPKHRRTSVERNRLKRRLREIGRTAVLPTLRAAGRELDVLVRARREAYEAGYETLLDELMEVTRGLCSEASSSV